MGRFAGFGDLVSKNFGGATATAQSEQDDYLDMLKGLGLVEKSIQVRPGDLAHFASMVGSVDQAALTSAMDVAKAEQSKRADQYHITVKENGRITKPTRYEGVPDEQWADPVNYTLALTTKEACDEALLALETPGSYTPEEVAIIKSRAETVKKGYEQAASRFNDAEARQRHCGIARKEFGERQQPTDFTTEPGAWADFTNHMFPLHSKESVAGSRQVWDSYNVLPADSHPYSEGERLLIRKAIEQAEAFYAANPEANLVKKDDSSDKPDMVDCPNCGKPIPDGTKTCPFCGKDVSDDDSSGPDAEDSKKQFSLEVASMGEALVRAYESNDEGEIRLATKQAMMVSQKAGKRHSSKDDNAIQGIHDHAMFLGADCSKDNVDSKETASGGAKSVTGSVGSVAPAGANTTDMSAEELVAIRTELDVVKAALAKANASDDPTSELAKAKEAALAREQETADLRAELEAEHAAKALLATELREKTARLDQLRAQPSVTPIQRKSVSVGSPEYQPQVPESGPPTLMEQYRRER